MFDERFGSALVLTKRGSPFANRHKRAPAFDDRGYESRRRIGRIRVALWMRRFRAFPRPACKRPAAQPDKRWLRCVR